MFWRLLVIMNREAISVSDLNKYIKNIFEFDSVLKNVLIKGEISNFKYHSSGHMYFTLKDADAKIKCIMFRTYNMGLKFMPEDGMKVVIGGSISVYERDGQYQLYCNKMDPDGIGSLFLAFEQLKEKLQAEGLFDENIKKPIPFFSGRIGVATSETGAVIRDIINVSTNRYKNVNILLYPVKVQGDGAAESIIAAIEYFNSRNDIDVVIIGRGGGSIEELWAFNNENLARKIRSSRIPIVSAVGHESDFTIADFVADLRASTPSHAAELCVPSYDSIKYKLSTIENSILFNFKSSIKNRRHSVNSKSSIVERFSPMNIITQKFQYIDNLQNRIIYMINKGITANRNDFLILASKIDGLSPIKILSRGYGFVEKSNKVMNSIKNLKTDDKIRIHLHDGYADCKIENTLEGELWQLKKEN
jgi:exodeoxyribonuclease VII large subunit